MSEWFAGILRSQMGSFERQFVFTRISKYLCLAFWLSCCSIELGGAQDLSVEKPKRPRTCLVLAGGGALGLAHVGVLRELEAMHIPIDCVTGTSMGAIVGGLYAAGYSPAELEDIVHELDWGALLRDTPDRRRQPFRSKVDDLTYLTRWEFGLSLKEGVKAPSGLVAGHRIAATLRLLALRAGGVEDFDDLRMPFRAIATDAVNGETVVLDHGELGRALRASMAIPGLFAPVELDGRLLVDGALVDNVPIAAAKTLDADFIIAVDLGKPLASRERPHSMLGILTETTRVLSRRETERALVGVDVVVRPEVENYGLLDFQAVDALIEKGIKAVHAQRASLQSLVLDDESWQAHTRAQRHDAPPLVIRDIDIAPLPGLNPERVKKTMQSQAGKRLDPKLLAEDLDRIWEHGEYEAVDFQLTPVGDEIWDLHVTARPKSWGPNYLRFGITLFSDLEGTSNFNALAAVSMTELNRFGAEFKLGMQAGDRSLLTAEIYQPLLPSRIPFASLGAGIGPTKRQLLVNTQLIQYRFVEDYVTVDLGLSLGRYGEFRAGLRRTHENGEATSEHDGDAPIYKRTDAGWHATLVLDQLDRVNFPRRGYLGSLEYSEASSVLDGKENYRRAAIQVIAAGTLTRHTLIGLVTGVSALGSELPLNERVQLGGLFNLTGLPPGELTGNYGGVATLIYMYRLGRLPNFVDGIYAGFAMDAGNAWEKTSDVDLRKLRKSYSVLFAVDTYLGPIYLAHGRESSGKDSMYLYLGRSF